MLIDRPEITETSALINATVASGTSYPSSPTPGELFYRTDTNQLRVYTGVEWLQLGSAAAHVLKAGDTMTGTLSIDIGGGTAGSTKHIELVNGAGHSMFMLPRTFAGAYNGLTQTGDAFLGYQANGAQDTGSLVIGPWTTSAKGIRIVSSGNVGISTADPVAELHVRPTNGTSSGSISLSGTSGASTIVMGNSDSGGSAGPSVIVAANRTLQLGAGTSFLDRAGGTFTSHLTVDSTGTMVAGTDLRVNGADGLLLQHDGANAFIRPTNTGATLYLGAEGTNTVSINTLGLAVTGSLSATQSIVGRSFYTTNNGTPGRAALREGNTVLTGFIEFLAPNDGPRQGYIGRSVTTAATDTGTIPYVAGTHAFTGTISGNGSGLTSLNASSLSSGTVPTARLGTGTADSTTYLRGDGSWTTINTGPSPLSVLKAGDTMTGALGIIGGTAAAPGLFFSGDTNTGIFSPATDTIAFAGGGAEAVRIDSSGNVAIGTSTTGLGRLVVVPPILPGTNAGRIQQRWTNYYNGGSNGYSAYLKNTSGLGMVLNTDWSARLSLGVITNEGTDDTTIAEHLTIISGGSVGIGTTSPTSRLHVVGGSAKFNTGAAAWGSWQSDLTGSSFMVFNQGGTTNAVGYIGTDGGGIVNGGSGTNFGVRAENDLILMTGAGADSTVKMRLSSTGVLSLSANTASTSTTSGTLVVTGGAGFSGTVHAGGFVGSLTGIASLATEAYTSNLVRFSDGTGFPGSSNAIGDSGGRNANLAPSTYLRQLSLEFKDSGLFGTAGNYAGLMTIAPWDGTTASTGDSSYQLLFSPNGAGANSTLPPNIWVRAGIDSTWGSWSTLLHSSNFNAWAPTLTGTGASGTWDINITGSAATLGGNAETSYLRYRGTITPATADAARSTGTYTVSHDTFSRMMIDIGGVGGSSPRLQLTADYRDELYFRVARDAETEFDGLAYPGYQLLHSNNFNTWAPTLTGGGASGTWNITSNRVAVTPSSANSTYYLLWNSGNDIYNNSNAAATAQVYLNPSNGQVNVGSLVASGNVTAFSDRRLKTNIQRIDAALSKVAAINGVTFTRLDTNEVSTGVIAQEVKEVLPEVVTEHADGTLSVAYGNMIGLLVEAIKELQDEVKALKAL